MNTEFHYKLLKLVNGENIVCSTDDDCSNLRSKASVFVCDPVLVTPVRVPRGLRIVESYVMTPWISITDEKIFEIATDQILVATDVKEHFKENYISYIDDTNQQQTEEKTKLEDSIQEMLHSALNRNTNESVEENEETNYIIAPGSKSIH